MTSQELMDYKLIDAKYRAQFNIKLKGSLLDICNDEKDIINERSKRIHYIKTFTSNNDPEEDAIHTATMKGDTVSKMKLKLSIYSYNGDVRNIVKYYHKYYTLASNFMEFIEECVENNSLKEALYINVCNCMAYDIRIFKMICDEVINQYNSR
jgi:hypothetical protein